MSSSTDTSKKQQLQDLRQRGNFQFSQQSYDTAVSLYSQAIEQAHASLPAGTLDTTEGSFHHELLLNLCNRSACWYQMQDYEQAKQDALLAYKYATGQTQDDDESKENETTTATSHNMAMILKAAYRLAKTHVALHEYQLAKDLIQLSLKRIQNQQMATPDEQATTETDTKDSETAKSQDEQESASDSQPVVAPPSLAQQQRAFEDLYQQVLQAALTQGRSKDDVEPRPETSVKYVVRPVSIKEFKKSTELGFGNFSDICLCHHKVTNERFALKMIEKKKAADLAKRQHPNVYNEIQMERRVLLERLRAKTDDNQPYCKYLVEMYHAFQDYTHLYYLMEFQPNGDLWSRMFDTYDKQRQERDESCKFQLSTTRKLVGCHRSQLVQWMWQLVDVLEFIHARGIVHRDLKPENILLDEHDNLVLIDFGTAKDLIQTDLNGPEFVGTPDFMSPEAVKGTSTIEETQKATANKNKDLTEGATHCADLWALGAILYITQCGKTPFWSTSPYLAFLKIKRCNLLRDGGIVDDACWDLIQSLMKENPRERLGASAFEVNTKGFGRKMICHSGGYDCIRQHKYFDAFRKEHDFQKRLHKANVPEEMSDDGNKPSIRFEPLTRPVPSLRDLCYQAVARQVVLESQDLTLCDDHPPGDGSKHDMMRLDPVDRKAVLHILDRHQWLRDPRVYARFFTNVVDCRITSKIRPATRNVVGWTQLNDDQGKAPNAPNPNDPYAKPLVLHDGIEIVHLTSPLFVEHVNKSLCEDERKNMIKMLKKCIAAINRNRPCLVIVCGFVDEKCRKLLARISESIPVVVHDGSAFFSAWCMGVQCLAIQQQQTQGEELTDHERQQSALDNDNSEQSKWIREWAEQVRLSKHPLFVFSNGDPRQIPPRMLKRLARGRALVLFGVATEIDPTNTANGIPSFPLTYTSSCAYTVPPKDKRKEGEDDVDSICSDKSDKDDERDSFTMKIVASCENGLRYLSVDDEPDSWKERFEPIGLQ